MRPRIDSYAILRDTLRWRVALVLACTITALMIALGTLNTHMGLADAARLAWAALGVALASIVALLALPRRTGGTVFFVSIAMLLLLIPLFGLRTGLHMQHWAYIFPPAVIFLLRPGYALLAMIGYGVFVSWITALLLPAMDVVRFGGGYGLLVCFMYTYALLQQRAAAMLRYHSDHDALTECFNRRSFNERLQRLVAANGAARRCAMLLIDIDHFKSVNDRLGHLVGDRVIAEVAAGLGRVLGPGTPLYRYGGEEFAVVLDGVDARAGGALGERLRRAIERSDFEGVEVTVSVGVAAWQADRDASIDAALGRADRALYAAKNAGRNRVVVDGATVAAALDTATVTPAEGSLLASGSRGP